MLTDIIYIATVDSLNFYDIYL